MAQTADGIVIVDQHAAHERLVYERMKKALADGGIARQPLLIPEVVDLDPALWRKGQDPQLERGVAIALKALQDHPVPPVKRPKYPVYDWQKVRSDATKSGAGSGQNN